MYDPIPRAKLLLQGGEIKKQPLPKRRWKQWPGQGLSVAAVCVCVCVCVCVVAADISLCFQSTDRRKEEAAASFYTLIREFLVTKCRSRLNCRCKLMK